MDFGKALSAAREKAGLSQAAVAAVVGCQPANIGAIESGRNGVVRDPGIVGRIEDAVGVSRGGLLKHLPAGHPAHRYYAPDAPPVVASGVGPAIPMAGRADGGKGQFREPGGRREFFRPRKYPPETVAVVVDGDSVSGFGVFGGDTIAVLPSLDSGDAHDGHLVVSQCNEGYVVKKWQGGKFWSMRSGDAGPTEEPSDQPTRIYGVVLGVIEGERSGELPKPPKKPRRK